jgi:hypothetical protein
VVVAAGDNQTDLVHKIKFWSKIDALDALAARFGDSGRPCGGARPQRSTQRREGTGWPPSTRRSSDGQRPGQSPTPFGDGWPGSAVAGIRSLVCPNSTYAGLYRSSPPSDNGPVTRAPSTRRPCLEMRVTGRPSGRSTRDGWRRAVSVLSSPSAAGDRYRSATYAVISSPESRLVSSIEDSPHRRSTLCIIFEFRIQHSNVYTHALRCFYWLAIASPILKHCISIQVDKPILAAKRELAQRRIYVSVIGANWPVTRPIRPRIPQTAQL